LRQIINSKTFFGAFGNGYRLVFLFLSSFIVIIPLHAQVFLKEGGNYNVNDSILTRRGAALNFIAMGDWGRNGDDHQKEVAAQMGKTSGGK
jgi:hypothetical protein